MAKKRQAFAVKLCELGEDDACIIYIYMYYILYAYIYI